MYFQSSVDQYRKCYQNRNWLFLSLPLPFATPFVFSSIYSQWVAGKSICVHFLSAGAFVNYSLGNASDMPHINMLDGFFWLYNSLIVFVPHRTSRAHLPWIKKKAQVSSLKHKYTWEQSHFLISAAWCVLVCFIKLNSHAYIKLIQFSFMRY